jgi:hypothetical protein
MLILDYFWWHYVVATVNILRIFRNYFVAAGNKFLIWQHARTLFSPWHRMQAKYMFPAQGFSDRIGNFFFEIFIRFVAAFLRLVIIIFGLLTQAAVIIIFAIILFVWIAWPFLVVIYVGKGLGLIL